MDKRLGKLKKIDNLRDYWPHEALDFTPWLAEESNISALSAAVGLDIVVEETESPVGSFSLDILARERYTDKVVIIENQLEETNHDHLGKIITYASGKEASYVIWLVRKAREEHRCAIEWLNSHTDDSVGFFLVEIELWSINDSDAAAYFQVVKQPNGWIKDIKQSAAGGDTLRSQFWNEFVGCVFTNASFAKAFRYRKPGNRHWYDLVPNGIRNFSLAASLDSRKQMMAMEIYIADDNELFARFLEQKQSIETLIGHELEWLELPNRKASRIVLRKSADIQNRNAWNEYFNWYRIYAEKMLQAFSAVL